MKIKSWTLKFRAADMALFESVRSGQKSVETRAASVKYQPIEVGDELVFSCGSQKFSKKIAAKKHFKSIDEMVAKIPFKHIMPAAQSVAEMKKVYASFPGYEEKIREFGIFAFELE